MTTNYRTNALGFQVPESKIDPLDLLRDDTVCKLAVGAKDLQRVMAEWKRNALADIAAFLEISANEYGVKFGGRKGNLALSSYDGRYQVLIAVSNSLAFDERLNTAKQLIDGCIREWSKDSNDNVKALVEHAFQTDRQGKINTARVLSLLRINITEPAWRTAMQALQDSIHVSNSTEYLRLYEKDPDTGKPRQISLDMASLS